MSKLYKVVSINLLTGAIDDTVGGLTTVQAKCAIINTIDEHMALLIDIGKVLSKIEDADKAHIYRTISSAAKKVDRFIQELDNGEYVNRDMYISLIGGAEDDKTGTVALRHIRTLGLILDLDN